MNALWDKLVAFSRRTPDKLESWSARPYIREWDDIARGDFDGQDADLIEMADATEDRGRYQAINLTNHDTVEFRLFRGTLKRSSLIATLQLVSNMTRYAAAHTPTACVHATWTACSWLPDDCYIKDDTNGALYDAADCLIDANGNVYGFDYDNDAVYPLRGTAYTPEGTFAPYDEDDAEYFPVADVKDLPR